MISTSELKKQAKSQLRGGWGLAIGGFFIAVFFFPLILFIIDFFIGGSLPIKITANLFTLVINYLLIVGGLKLSLNYAKSEKKPFLDDIFFGFKVALKALLLYVIMIPFAALNSAMLVLPGIIFSIVFSQTLFVLVDNDNKCAVSCLKESVNMMKGHILEYIKLFISFIGWFALLILPVFILRAFPLPIYIGLIYLLVLIVGFLMLIIYMNVTFALFYLKIKDNYNKV